jgi:hypothetical protein
LDRITILTSFHAGEGKESIGKEKVEESEQRQLYFINLVCYWEAVHRPRPHQRCLLEHFSQSDLPGLPIITE